MLRRLALGAVVTFGKEFPLTSRCYRNFRRGLISGNNSASYGWPFLDEQRCNFVDEGGRPLKAGACVLEHAMHRFAEAYLRPTDAVLELGARYGTTTCAAARFAARVVSLEPDASVIAALGGNVARNGCNATVVNGALSTGLRGPLAVARAGYGTRLSDAAPSGSGRDAAAVAAFTVEALEAAHLRRGARFDALFADCEDCFATLEADFSGFLDRVRLVVLELDGVGPFESLFSSLEAHHGLVVVEVASGPRQVQTAAFLRGGRRCGARAEGGCACALRTASFVSRCTFPCLCGPPCD